MISITYQKIITKFDDLFFLMKHTVSNYNDA